MKKKNFKKIALASVLALSMTFMQVCQSPVEALSFKDFFNWVSNVINKDSTTTELSLVEDETTVENGNMLRASTYDLTTKSGSTVVDGKTLKYFPVTMYDYDNDYNNALHQQEVDEALAKDDINTLTQWKGIYFGGNNLGAHTLNGDSFTYRTNGTVSYSSTSVSYSSSNNYSNYTRGDHYVKVKDEYFVVNGISCTRTGGSWNYKYKWTITYDGRTTTSTNSSITLYTRSSSTSGTTGTLQYANYNKWTGDFTSNNVASGNRIYSGMVNSELDANKNIQFNYPQAGIFTNDETNKKVYTNVELPFVYTSNDGYYTFDANEDGVYFHNDTSQGTSETPASNSKLYFTDTPQSHDFSAQDNRTKGWFPFSNSNSIQSSQQSNYFFGMNATIPFTMTANGRMNANNNNSAPIKFDFSGDDDVWVFIDGKLVLDIGGVRNMLEGSIDFAENTYKITKPTSNGGNALGDAATPQIPLSGKLFNDGNVKGILNTTRESFAATDEHNLTIYYLERGAGSSNCKIKFNLPMKDNVSVKKLITQSKTNDGKIYPLTESEKAQVNSQNFGFTLYKDNQAVSNATYVLTDINGQAIKTQSTDANGHFTLQNGQTAKFIGQINNNTYHVVEDEKDGYLVPDYKFSASTANDTTEAVGASGWTSMKVDASGSDESEDSVQFTCTNYLSANLPNPSLYPEDDMIVIDYGLPVEIENVLKNDLWKGESIELLSVTGNKYGAVDFDSNGRIKYTLNSQLNNVEVLTYEARVTGTGNSGETTTVETTRATGTVYIIPATTMYYEEDFSGLVTFNNGKSSGWKNIINYKQGDMQETGVVGSPSNSPYGSDKAYLNNQGDSYGTSKYVDTTDGAAQFSYTFTGEGTSFFGRTTNNSGYMRVVINKVNDNGTVNQTPVYDLIRDTSYKQNTSDDDEKLTNPTLYNIPIFTWEAENYGTYKVTVTIPKYTPTKGYGKDFWLDGIRVVNPLSYSDSHYDIATSAYASDGEANMTVATLRQKLLKVASETPEGGIVWNPKDGFVVFTDTNGAILSADEYESNGPKEEVYLAKNQSVSFSLNDWDANTNKIYLGIKAPVGQGTVEINGHTLNINNTTDCYYNITSYADIKTVDGHTIATFKITSNTNIISVTNIKVTGETQFIIVPGKDKNEDGSEGGDINGD